MIQDRRANYNKQSASEFYSNSHIEVFPIRIGYTPPQGMSGIMESIYSQINNAAKTVFTSRYIPTVILLSTIGIFLFVWAFESSFFIDFNIFLLAAIIFIPPIVILAAWIMRPRLPMLSPSAMDELKKEIEDAKTNRLFLFIITVIIGGYVGFQAIKVIQIADRGGVESQFIIELRGIVEQERENLFYITQRIIERDGNSLPLEDMEVYREEAESQLEEAEAQYITELRSIEEDRRRVDGRFLFDFLSSFFVRIASVGISLTFFAVSLTQYRKIDLRILELSQLKIAHSLSTTETSPDLLKKYRQVVSIAEAPTKSLHDDTEIAIPREAFNGMLSVFEKIGLSDLVKKEKSP